MTAVDLDTAGPAAPPSIEDYAAIGNCRTLALVSRWGSIDWWCLPAFSGPSVFAALLDSGRGGRFELAPGGVRSAGQSYEPVSNVLRTRYECATGVMEVLDFMAMPHVPGRSHEEEASQEIVRIARCVAGSIELRLWFEPRPHYASELPAFTSEGPNEWHCSARGVNLRLSTTFELQASAEHLLQGAVSMQPGDEHVAILRSAAGRPAQHSLRSEARNHLAATLAWWRHWCTHCTFQGAHSEAVMRSALALKLLTHEPTGAVVAAGTTSLPESETGARNWDYRYCWLRDTSLVLHAFNDLGYTAESDAFLRWLLHATHKTRPRLQVVYDVHGGTLLHERTLPNLRGYHGIGPVRIGNAAAQQVQNDIYGEVILTAWDHAQSGGALNRQECELIAGFAGVVCDLWHQPDHGIWEIRLPPRHNTHSKLMCWAGLDRALGLHEHHRVPIDKSRVLAAREAIRADIEAHAFNPAVNSYVGYYGSDAADASLLLIPRLGYLDANHPRMIGTVRHIMDQLLVDGLLYRYPPGGAYDGISGPEHLFAICGFWCVDCLARQGRIEEAQQMYERLLGLRNHAGLYAEEFSTTDGRPMGNFPQAFSHVGAITAALTLDQARARREAMA